MVRTLAFFTIWCLALPAAAQDGGLPTGLDYPARAMALRPTGMLLQRFEYNTFLLSEPGMRPSTPPRRTDGFDYAWNEIEARIPYESLLIDVAAGANLVIDKLDPRVVDVVTNNLEIGASFRDAPAPGVRYELGGAVVLPTSSDNVVARSPPRSALRYFYPTLPVGSGLFHQRGAGWNPQRFLPSSFAVVAHSRVEMDPIRAMALGLEVDVPVLVDAKSGGVNVLPQVALEVAGRFETTCLAGLRGELTTTYGPVTRDRVGIALEPFVRLALPAGRTNVFVRLGLRVPLGPAYPFVTENPIGIIGGSLAGGVLY